VADARSRYSVVEDVVDNLRAAGVSEIGLITEEPHENTPQKTAAAAPAQ
jgi:biopolymer transport protein ExbD